MAPLNSQSFQSNPRRRTRPRHHPLFYLNVFNRALQSESEWRFKLNPFAFALAAHVGEVLFLAWIDWQIFRSRVFAHDHSFVNVLLRTNEKPAALLNIVERVSSADPGFHRHHHAAPAPANLALEWRVFAEEMTH